jgi:hypothetical protein
MYLDQTLTLEIIAPSYHGFSTFYQYRMNEGEWSDLGAITSLQFKDQKPGYYNLSIRSKKEGGYLWSEPAKIELEVKTYWYRNPVMMGFIILLIIAIVIILLIKSKQKYRQNISKLTQGLQQEQDEIVRRDADLEKAKDSIQFEQRQIRAQTFSLEIIRRLVSKINPGMKWDMVMEVISIDLLKFPGVVAFEIGTRNGKYIDLEGYSEHKKGFTTTRFEHQPEANFSSYALDCARPMIFDVLEEEFEGLTLKKEKRLNHYLSAVSVPFYLENKPAVLLLYSDKPRYFTKFGLKAIEVFTTYLEQIV